MEELYKQFAVASNAIEGESDTTDKQIQAVFEAALLGEGRGSFTLGTILGLHSLCGQHLEADWVGKWRDIQVCVGKYVPPAPEFVPKQMETFIRQLPMMDSWQAHNLFQKIHPFQDLNGRVGRLVWLHKAIKEGYDFEISFLHKYYYQTLEHSEL